MELLKRLSGLIGLREVMLVAGLAMLGGGAHLAWVPLGLLLPGAALTAIAVFGLREIG